MAINIGNNNKLKNVSIVENSDTGGFKTEGKNFAERHPVIFGLFCSLVVGLILMFSFWQKIIQFIEGLF